MLEARETAWEPDPAWATLPHSGRSGARLWLAESSGRTWVVKRAARPLPGDPRELSDPRHFGYWRREADLALAGDVVATAGLRSPEVLRVDEDETGVVLWQAAVDQSETSGLFRAQALGRFATQNLPERPWTTTGVLRSRLIAVERRGGWPTLARTTLADVADRLWTRRGHHLNALDSLPLVPAHGDATPANLRGREGDDVLALDWGGYGLAPLGFDLGYLALSEKEDFEVLLSAYVEAAGRDHAQVLLGARITAVYTVLMRAEHVLARAAVSPGALAGKYRHPSVAPTLRRLQRVFDQVEALL